MHTCREVQTVMSTLLHRRAAIAAGVASAVVIALGSYASLSRSEARGLETFGDVPEFALIDHLERPVISTEFRGKVVVANFIYTSCRDICPLLSVQMKSLQERLRQDHLADGRVQLLSFTVDPVRDTPPVLRAYAERHEADPAVWRFVTGPEDTLVPLIVDGFRLGATALPPGPASQGEHRMGGESQTSYEVMHGARFVLIDRRGQIRAYPDGRDLDIDELVANIRRLLR